jgi:hypothetical protein
MPPQESNNRRDGNGKATSLPVDRQQSAHHKSKNIHEDETNKQAKKADKVHRTLFAMMTKKFRPA